MIICLLVETIIKVVWIVYFGPLVFSSSKFWNPYYLAEILQAHSLPKVNIIFISLPSPSFSFSEIFSRTDVADKYFAKHIKKNYTILTWRKSVAPNWNIFNMKTFLWVNDVFSFDQILCTTFLPLFINILSKGSLYFILLLLIIDDCWCLGPV